MNTTEKESALFSVYKSQTTNQYFVKYPDMPEREITLYEYNNLLNEKERIFEAKMKEPIVFENKNIDYEDIFTDEVSKHAVYIFKSNEDIKDFVSGTCYGKMYFSDNCIVIDSIFNKEKHNGDFIKTINAFVLMSQTKDLKLTICNVNQKLFKHIKESIYFETLMVNKDTIIII